VDTPSRPRCHADTRVVKFLSEWVTSMNEDNILWLPDVAGSGRSTLITTVTDVYRSIRRLGTFIYFNRGESAYAQPTQVVGTMAFQLAKFDSRIGAAISSVIDGDSQTLTGTLLAQFTSLLANPIGAVKDLAEEGPVIVIVDALDECGSPTDRKDLISIRQGRTSSALVPFHHHRPIRT
jgi:hypothetical protein